MHHSGLQLAVNSGLQGQNTPCSISAGARVTKLCRKRTKHFPTRVDPDTNAAPDKRCPMRIASDYGYVETMIELANYTEPDEEVVESSVWELVEKEQARR